MSGGGAVTYYHTDHLGSHHVTTNSSGTQTLVTNYLPFGEFESTPPTGTEGPNYTGQHYDAETGLYYYGARYYNPKIGRFLNADWIVQSPFNSQSYNRFSYVGNNPLNFVDPSGNQSLGGAIILSDYDLDGIQFSNISNIPSFTYYQPPQHLGDGVWTAPTVFRFENRDYQPSSSSFGTDALKRSVISEQDFALAGTPIYLRRQVENGAVNVAGNLTPGQFVGAATVFYGPEYVVGKYLAHTLKPSRTILLGTLRKLLLKTAGFSDEGIPIILDVNLQKAGFAQALRKGGYNVRSVQEIFGTSTVTDKTINDFANSIGARVLTRDRGRQIGGGFLQNAIQVDSRVQSVDGIIRILEGAL